MAQDICTHVYMDGSLYPWWHSSDRGMPRAKGPLSGSSPLCRFCRLAPPLISKFSEGQSYPSEDQT